MMRVPRSRAFLRVSFIGPAISATRRAADLHQWSSHMSQTMIAVFRGSHEARISATEIFPWSLLRDRRLSWKGALSAGLACGCCARPDRAARAQTRAATSVVLGMRKFLGRGRHPGSNTDAF